MSPFLNFIRDKGDGGGIDNWNYKTCKVPVKMSPPTNQHKLDALPVAQPTVSQHLNQHMLDALPVAQPTVSQHLNQHKLDALPVAQPTVSQHLNRAVAFHVSK